MPLCVALSGGLDSTVLLHVLAGDPDVRARGLRALHVHHGLHPDADAWQRHAEALCAALDVPLEVRRVQVDLASGHGVEGAARIARYAAFAEALQPGEVLALAHHRDDQAETFLLRALRASGVDGLSAMRPWRALGRGFLWRPFLATPRAELAAYARAHGLAWVDDPANANPEFDRNYLRSTVLPALRARWPHADAALARAATLAQEAADALAVHTDADLAAVRDAHGLSVSGLRALPDAARARVLRQWVQALGWPPLPATALPRIDRELLQAPADRQPVYAWHGVALRRWRDHLVARADWPRWPEGWQVAWDGRAPLALPVGGTLALEGADALPNPVRVTGRVGGEQLLLPGRTHRHRLKHLLQEADLPPWERDALPVLRDAGTGEVLAAGDAWVAAPLQRWLQAQGARLRWSRTA